MNKLSLPPKANAQKTSRSGRPSVKGSAPHKKGDRTASPAGRGKKDGFRPKDRSEQERPQNPDIICGRNAVMEALKSGLAINKIWLADNNDPAFSGAVFALAKEAGVPCQKIPRMKLSQIAGEDHRGVAAEASPIPYVELEDLLARAAEKEEAPFLILLDGVEDPHNLGAVIRTALCAGAHGVVVPRRRAAAITGTVLSTSAGAAAYLPVARVANMTQAIRTLQEQGCWVLAADMDGSSLWESDLTGPLAIVVGGEGQGVSQLVKKTCDGVISIPMHGTVGSLNVSNAAAIVLYEAARKRAGK